MFRPDVPASRNAQTELIGLEGHWSDLEHVEYATLNWVDWFNTERPLSQSTT